MKDSIKCTIIYTDKTESTPNYLPPRLTHTSEDHHTKTLVIHETDREKEFSHWRRRTTIITESPLEHSKNGVEATLDWHFLRAPKFNYTTADIIVAFQTKTSTIEITSVFRGPTEKLTQVLIDNINHITDSPFFTRIKQEEDEST